MKLRQLVVLTTMALQSVAAVLNYNQAMTAIVYNTVRPNDQSRGEVSFDGDVSILADYGVTVPANLTISTYTSYNYLTSLVGLAREAAAKGMHGDYIILLYKFLYAGQYNSTSVTEESDLLNDLSEILNNLEINKRDIDSSIYEDLRASSSNSDVRAVYDTAVELKRKTTRWTKETCYSKHQANRSDCKDLISRIENDLSIKTGNPRNIQWGTCFISWSSNATFNLNNLCNAAQRCMDICDDKTNSNSSSTSCEIYDVLLNGHKVNLCLSNRASECE